jgi:hypothetical protein
MGGKSKQSLEMIQRNNQELLNESEDWADSSDESSDDDVIEVTGGAPPPYDVMCLMPSTTDDAPAPAAWPEAPPEDLEDQDVTDAAVRQYSLGLATVHVCQLYFDRRLQWGQLRTVEDDRVNGYVEDLAEDPPRVLISGLLLRRLPNGM